jgi:ABC-type branched-subunit amino acid transport system ATPase component
VEIGYPGKTLVRVPNFRAGSRDLVGIRGANGSGKTTMLRTLAGLLAPLSGGWDFMIDGKASVLRRELRRGRIIFLPQRRTTFLTLSVRENLEVISRRSATRAIDHCANYWTPGAHFVANNLNRYPANMSGGERQIVALTAALASRARVLLLDEPTEGLSASLKRDVFASLKRTAEADERVIICVEHDVTTLGEHSDRIYEVSAELLVERS